MSVAEGPSGAFFGWRRKSARSHQQATSFFQKLDAPLAKSRKPAIVAGERSGRPQCKLRHCGLPPLIKQLPHSTAADEIDNCEQDDRTQERDEEGHQIEATAGDRNTTDERRNHEASQ